ncbi:response regulator [Clostridium gasigenes]|uniref:response regulator n=1 Tax=Clostridium gasigenes TaxID=94869 RepID=UPI0014384BD2|nr:response regulator [Clostridium gasigenes]NKF07977.1 response regulator [Clostridium gasigenes]QSW20645.1 response regulator [Clostridium gasigenes]
MKTALVVDDTKNIRLLLSKCLENENYIVHAASNATEALELVSKHNFDIAFIDIKMPNISGTALLELLRSKGHTFPVIIMTAFGTIRNAVTTTQLGAKAYLQKPFTALTIRKTLLEVFPNDISSLETSSKDIIENNLSFNSLKLSLCDNPTNPSIYKEIGEVLINLGETEKGELFRDFSDKLNKLK